MKTMENIWQQSNFCKNYLRNIQISTEDVHYGYLSPGEKELGLLGPTQNLKGKWIVEIGCGAAQNCIALAKWGANCTGIDISDAMLQIGRKLVKKEKVDIELICDDARNLVELLKRSRYGHKKVSIFISSFAISFICHDIVELLNLFKTVRQNIDPQGLFVFCFSHPSQKPDKITGIETDYQKWTEAYFTIAEVTQNLDSAGFAVKKTVEQTTKNPSKMSPEEKRRFPYKVINLNPRFDQFTHKPHTIIYVARPK